MEGGILPCPLLQGGGGNGNTGSKLHLSSSNALKTAKTYPFDSDNRAFFYENMSSILCSGFLNGNTPCIVLWKYAVDFSMEILRALKHAQSFR